MNKVITINLNGRAYPLEESGYDALRRYLDEARAALGDNPDKDEIMADFEQAIADKCDAYLRAGKTVVTAAEMDEVIKKMGPVNGPGAGAHVGADGGPAQGADAKAGPAARSYKKLYRIRENAWLFGVCSGLAAYFNVDVTLMRVLFVILTLLTHIGGGLIIYLVMALVMRPARTEDEVAAAHGAAPFTAHDFIAQARAEYEKFRADHAAGVDAWHNGGKQEFKARMRQLKREWKYKWHGAGTVEGAPNDKDPYSYTYKYEYRYPYGGGSGKGASIFAGIVIAILTIVWILAVIAFLTKGIVFGLVFGIGQPIWLSLSFITALYYVLITPFKMMAMNAYCRREGDRCRNAYGWRFTRTVFFLIALGVLAYTAVHLFPSAGAVWHEASVYLNTPR